MPNWCSNTIKICGQAKNIINFVESMKGFRPTYKCDRENGIEENEITYTFNAAVPVPEEITNQTYHSAGYSWQCDNWGTKWDTLDEAKWSLDKILAEAKASDEDEIMEGCFSFNTAWAPPYEWFREVVDKPFGLVYEFSFEEGGCGIFGKVVVDGEGGWDEVSYDNEIEFRYFVDDCSLSELVECAFEWYCEGNGYTRERTISEIVGLFYFYPRQQDIENMVASYVNSLSDDDFGDEGIEEENSEVAATAIEELEAEPIESLTVYR